MVDNRIKEQKKPKKPRKTNKKLFLFLFLGGNFYFIFFVIFLLTNVFFMLYCICGDRLSIFRPVFLFFLKIFLDKNIFYLFCDFSQIFLDIAEIHAIMVVWR